MADKYGFDRTRIDKAEVISVIRVTSVIGEGTEKDPCRHVYRYYSLDGKPIASSDSWKESQQWLE